MDEFVMFSTLNDVVLNDEKDTITWKWISSGKYSAASAYEAQFLGAFSQFRVCTIWQAKTEAKCRFFVRLALLGKAPEMDNL
jgi:hypothetical protein